MIELLVVLITLAIALAWLKIFKALKLLDKPGPDVPKRDRVPTIQWVFLFIAFLINIAIFYKEYFLNKAFLWLLIWWLLIVWIALIDSFRHVNPKIRLLIQALVWAIAFYVWWVWFFELDFNWININLPLLLALFVTMFWFAWFINVINWFDWVYGLASWTSSIWFLTIYLLLKFTVLPYYTWISPENLANLEMVINVSFILFAVSAIYSAIEFKPLWVLRDVWTMFLWFALAYLALQWWAKIWTILVVLSLPIFDAIWVFINRIFVIKKNPLKWDYTHLHYRLLAMAWNRTEIRFFIWGWSLFLMVLMLLQWVNRFNKIVIFTMMFVIFFWVNIYLFWVKKFPLEYKIKK